MISGVIVSLFRNFNYINNLFWNVSWIWFLKDFKWILLKNFKARIKWSYMVNVKPAPNKINLVIENFIFFILVYCFMPRILSYLPDPCAVPITKRTAWCGSRTLHWVKYPYVAVIARDLSQDKLKGIIFDIRGESISPFK